MPRKSKKDQCPEMVCGIPRANLEQFARFICPYIEEYFADEKNMAEYQKLKASGKLSQNSHTFNAQKAAADRMPDFVVVKFRYVYMSEVAKDIYNTTYEELAAYFGVEGQFVKEEYSDHMQENRRYYKWISSENANHFTYVNFAEREPGRFVVCAFNTSGFSGSEAKEKYLDIVKAEAAEVDKAAAANMPMKDFTLEVTQFAKDDVKVTITTTIPESGWSSTKDSLVENEDPTAFGAGEIIFTVQDNVEKFDNNKSSFKNYQDIEDRVIGGITFKGRTYEYIGYSWIEYVAQIDEGRALSIGLAKMDCFPGTAPDIILNNMQFK